MEKFKQNEKRFLICPWCPEGAITVLIENCPHNPFKLKQRIQELEQDSFRQSKALLLLQDLKQLLSEI